jgi:drug/metabolite transporter (DMT)-like permease
LAGGALIGIGPILGLISALSWGAGDFCGGLISRYASIFTAMVTVQSVGLAGALVLLAASGEAAPPPEALVFAAIAGAVGVGGLACFYLALGRGTMGIVAPLAALIGAGVPVMVAVMGGEQVSAGRLAGIGLALAAVVLISLPGGESTPDERRALRIDLAELPLVVLSGLGFAGFFIFIDRAAASGGELWWPLAAVRTVGLTMVLLGVVLALLRARGATVRQRAAHVLGIGRLRRWPFGGFALGALFVVGGLGDLGGNVFFVLSRHAGVFSVAVVLSSLYPVITTVLAVLLLRERLRLTQIGGVVLATLSVALLH